MKNKSRNKRKQRIRRTAKQVLKFGAKAKRKHTKISGRSGSIHEKKTPAKK